MLHLTCVGPCIKIYFYSKTSQMHNISNLFYFGTILYMFRMVSPSETCRVLFQNKINLRYCASGWFYYRNILVTLCVHFLTSLCIALHGTIYSPWCTCTYYEHSWKVCRQANWAAARLEHAPACLIGSSCSNTTSSTEVSLAKSYYYEHGWVYKNRVTENALGCVSWDSNVFGANHRISWKGNIVVTDKPTT